jgi:hypothetical protein
MVTQCAMGRRAEPDHSFRPATDSSASRCSGSVSRTVFIETLLVHLEFISITITGDGERDTS